MSYTPLNNTVLTGTPEVMDDIEIHDDVLLDSGSALNWDSGAATLSYDGMEDVLVSDSAIRVSAAPSNDDDLTNKAYVDSVAMGLDVKASVRVASQADVDLSAPGAAIDGVTLAQGDRVLVKAQDAAEENGIYVFDTDVTAMVRAMDADSDAEVTAGMFTFVEQGTNADQGWVLTTDNPIDLGVTELVFSQFSNAVIVSTLDSLTDVDVTGAVANSALVFDGSDWYDSENILLDDANSKVELGGDVNLYREDADILATDDAMHIAGKITGDDGAELTAGDMALSTDEGQIILGASGDVNLYHGGADLLKTDDSLEVALDLNLSGAASKIVVDGHTTPGDDVLTVKWDGDAANRLEIENTGNIAWGNGTDAPDVNLYRASADNLETDDDFTAANLLSGGDLDVQGAVKLGSSDVIELIENGDNELEIVGADLRTDNRIKIDMDNDLTVYVEDGVSDSYASYGAERIDFGGANNSATIEYSDANELLDIEAPLIRLRDTLEIEEGLRFTGKQTISANATLDADNDHVVLVDVSGGAVTVTLPAAPADGTIFQIKDMMGNAEAENITVAGNGKNIDGAADFVMGVDFQSSTVIYDAVADAWFLI